MRKIVLLRNKAGEWFVHTLANNGNVISTEEGFSTPSKAQEAFMKEGRHQPYAKMVLEIHGEKPITVRKASPLPANAALQEAEQVQLGMVRAAMKLKHLH